jgi:(E)-2-((N-methylformamido)methylene)succinate hydrolase
MTERMLQRRGAPALRYWDDGGEKPPVMLIHGVGADGTSWHQIAAALASEFRVLRLDLRGHGYSGHIEGALTLDDFVQDVVDVMDACPAPAAHIVGFSLGGMIAQDIALQHVRRVHRLVLLSAVAGRTAEERERVRTRLAILQDQGIAAIAGAAQERWFTPGFIARHPPRCTAHGAVAGEPRALLRGRVHRVLHERSRRAVACDPCTDVDRDRGG